MTLRGASVVVAAVVAWGCAGDAAGPIDGGPEMATVPVCISEAVTCCGGANCQLARTVKTPAECTSGQMARIAPTGEVIVPRRTPISRITNAIGRRASLLAEAVGFIPRVASAQSEEILYFGIRDGQNMSGPGAQKRCEAKLHTCFIKGIFDEMLNDPDNVIDTVNDCNLVCDSTNSPQGACTTFDCVSRCLAARVPGSEPTCQ